MPDTKNNLFKSSDDDEVVFGWGMACNLTAGVLGAALLLKFFLS